MAVAAGDAKAADVGQAHDLAIDESWSDQLLAHADGFAGIVSAGDDEVMAFAQTEIRRKSVRLPLQADRIGAA